jgi:NitT/TauT family transport system substrate-binding protein
LEDFTMRQRAFAATLIAFALAATACTDDPNDDSDGGGAAEVAADAPFPESRCEANRAAGTISYLTGFDYAATASIVEVLVADAKGYFDELCLDVDIAASAPTHRRWCSWRRCNRLEFQCQSQGRRGL